MPTITVENVSKYYGRRRWWRRGSASRREIGVKDVNLTIEQGEFVFVIGSNGAGKSTLLNLLSGRIKPNSGAVYLDGQNLSKLKHWNPNRVARMIGRVPQQSGLDRGVVIGKNLERSVKVGRKFFDGGETVEKRIRKVLGLTGMSGAEDRYPIELTVGERRRVELARALINSPPILILDEVTANLDEDSTWDVFLLLTELNRRGTTVIMATHNSRYVNMLRRRVITLVDGRIYSDVEKGRYGEVKKREDTTDPATDHQVH